MVALTFSFLLGMQAILSGQDGVCVAPFSPLKILIVRFTRLPTYGSRKSSRTSRPIFPVIETPRFSHATYRATVKTPVITELIFPCDDVIRYIRGVTVKAEMRPTTVASITWITGLNG